jgi:hypothetical protein
MKVLTKSIFKCEVVLLFWTGLLLSYRGENSGWFNEPFSVSGGFS